MKIQGPRMQFEKELHLARAAAMHGGEMALGYQTRGVTAEWKPDATPVTIADRETEKSIVSEILNAFPDDGIMGEEGSSSAGRNGRRWIIDPIDGTREFLRGYELWAVLIGLEVQGEVVAGVAHFPARKQMFSALKGHGAYLNEKRISISDVREPSKSLVCWNGLSSVVRQAYAPRAVEWMSHFGAIRSFGGALDAMMVASGQAEAWIENTCKPWDLAPLQIIAEEAGAKFFDFTGKRTIYGNNGVICVPALEPELKALLGI